MIVQKQDPWVRYVLFSSGVVDLGAALALFFPVFNQPLPGYEAYTPQLAFIAGGWGVAALTFGIGRIWSCYKPEFYRVMVTLGLLEGSILTLFCLANILFLRITWLQALLPLAVGSLYGVLYLTTLLRLKKTQIAA